MNSKGAVVSLDGTIHYSLFKVSLIKSDSTCTWNELLDGVSCERAFQELIKISADSSNDTTEYTIFDKFNGELAIMISAKSLRCSRNVLIHRLCMARELYEFRVKADYYLPVVEII